MAGLRSLRLSSVRHRCRGRRGYRRGRWGCGRGGWRAAPPGETGRGGADLRTGRRRGARSPGGCAGRSRPWALAAGGWLGGGLEGRGGALGGSRCHRRPPPPLLPARPQPRSFSRAGELPAPAGALLTYNFLAPALPPASYPLCAGARRQAPPPPFLLSSPPRPPRALPWQLNKQTRRTWGRGGGRGAGGARRAVTPARQLAGRSRADAGGGGGSGPGVGLWVRGAGLVAARPGRSVSPRAAPWVRSPRSRRPVGAKGDGNAPPPPSRDALVELSAL